jgi:ankyrin repeat protein
MKTGGRMSCTLSLCRALIVAAICWPLLATAGAYDDFFTAAKFDDIATMQDLLQRGVDPNTREEKRGETGIMVALRDNSMKVFDALLAAPGLQIEARANNGDTALMIASFQGNLEAVKKLVTAGAEVNQPGWTALHYAAANGDTDLIAFLLENYAYIDAESPNKTTPLMMAVRAGKIYAVKLLLDEGADLTVKNDQGMTALDFARHYEQPDIIEGLEYRMKQKK